MDHELPPAAAAIDPSTATTAQEYGELVARLIRACSLTRNQAAELAQMSTDTVHAMVHGKRLGKPGTVTRLLDACGLSGDLKTKWESKWLDLASEQSQVGAQRVHDQLAKTERELSSAIKQIAALRDEETRLQEKLAAEQQRVTLLEVDRTSQEKIVADMKRQLKYAQSEIINTENRLRFLLEEKEVLEAAYDALEAQLELLMREQRLREDAEGRVVRLREQNDELGRSMLRLQGELSPAPKPAVKEAKPEPQKQKDTPLETEIAVRDSNFGLPFDFMVTFPWFCFLCDVGGSKRHRACPHCGGEISHNEERFIEIQSLPVEPSYGKVLRVANQGNHDDPKLARGDLHARITRRPGRWERR